MFDWLRQILRLGPAPATGTWGEQLAAEWLVRERGFIIAARNWRSPRDRRDELDLVARDGDALVFIEVKTRAPDARVPGYFAVNVRKKRVVLRAAEAYLRRLRDKPRTVRFDIVEVELPSLVKAPEGAPPTSEPRQMGGPVIRHFENIPLFPKIFVP